MVNGEVVPISYIRTLELCKWRFVLFGAIESEIKADEIIKNPSFEGGLHLLTRVRKDLYLMSDVVIDGKKIVLNTDKKYEEDMLNMEEAEKEFLYMGVDAAIASLIYGAIEDARRKQFPEKYRSEVLEKVPSDPVVVVNDNPYDGFEAAIYLLFIALSVKSEEEDEFVDYISLSARHRRSEVRQMSRCRVCPFLDYCERRLEGGTIHEFWDALRDIISVAMYWEAKSGVGWYLLYRAAIRLLTYKQVNSPKILGAFNTETRRLVNVNFKSVLRYSDTIEKMNSNIQLDKSSTAELANMLDSFKKGGIIVDWDDYVNNEFVRFLIQKRFFRPVLCNPSDCLVKREIFTHDDGPEIYRHVLMSLRLGPEFFRVLGGDEHEK